MKKEKIKLTKAEVDNLMDKEDIKSGKKIKYKYVGSQDLDSDVEDGWESQELIMQRVSDGKFFKGFITYVRDAGVVLDEENLEYEECVPKTVTEIIYK